MGKMLGSIGYAKQRRVSLYLYSLAIRHELKYTKPSVTTVAFPSASEDLHIEHHLMHIATGSILVDTICHRVLKIARTTGVSAKSEHYIGRRIDQFFPDLLAPVARSDFIGLIVGILCRTLAQ